MIPFILKLQRHANTLLDRLTADRASRLDEITSTRMARLDAAISSVRGIKSIQTGFFSTSSLSEGSGEDNRYVDTTISAVVVANCQCYLGVNGHVYTARLTSTTNVRVSAWATPPQMVVRWWVIEHA
jgi:hypothetical protein